MVLVYSTCGPCELQAADKVHRVIADEGTVIHICHAFMVNVFEKIIRKCRYIFFLLKKRNVYADQKRNKLEIMHCKINWARIFV